MCADTQINGGLYLQLHLTTNQNKAIILLYDCDMI